MEEGDVVISKREDSEWTIRKLDNDRVVLASVTNETQRLIDVKQLENEYSIIGIKK